MSCYCAVGDYFAALAVCQQYAQEKLEGMMHSQLEGTIHSQLEGTIHSQLEAQVRGLISELEEKKSKLERVTERLKVLQKKEEEARMEHGQENENENENEEGGNDALSVWSQSTAATGISAITGMTAFFEPGRTTNVLGVSSVEDIAALSHRAGNTAIHSRRSVKVMQFGESLSTQRKERGKKRRIREGSPQEKEALVKMADLLLNDKGDDSEVASLTEVLLILQHRELAKTLQGHWKEYVQCVNRAKQELKIDCTTELKFYSWIES